MPNEIVLISFEVGVLRGYENVRSAHIQLLYGLAERLARQGIQPTLITNQLRADTFIPTDIQRNVRIKHISDPRRRNKTNVMHSGFSKKINLFGLILAILQILIYAHSKRPVAVHFVNGGIEIGYFSSVISWLSLNRFIVLWTPSVSSLPLSRLLKLALSKHARIIASTSYQYHQFLGVSSAVSIIKYGPSRAFGRCLGPKHRITFWRDPSYENGADIAYQSFFELSHEFPDITYTIMVRPYFDSVLPEQIDSHLPHNLEIYEFPYPDSLSLEKVMSETLLCVFPFRELSTNPQLCVLESVASGIPCLVTSVESLPEYVLDNLYLLDSCTSVSLSNRIRSLITQIRALPSPTNPGHNGFSWDSFLDLYLQIYKLTLK